MLTQDTIAINQTGGGGNMLKAAKVLLIIGGLLLLLDAVLMAARIPNPLFGWPLPCPVTLAVLGLGLILFSISSKAFSK
jgi:hypothetical protein